jgi:beta-fructofuranosidase
MKDDKNLKLTHKGLLEQANCSVREAQKYVGSDPHRLGYHIMPPAYWMNDPNGLIQYRGEYHVFYQHHPYGAQWGLMHWGHAKSTDLVHWEHLPIALAPSEEYERGGCFSGCAVNDNGVLTLIYTGNNYVDHIEALNRENAMGKKRIQVQCIATSMDGINFMKFSGNPVISNPPPDGSYEFRDPKVWRFKDWWYMIVGTEKDGVGRAFLYKSQNLRKWEYIGITAESNDSQGFLWECPDVFSVDDKQVLIVSPKYTNGRANIYFVGEIDYETGKFTKEYYEKLDYGVDFYAAQTFFDEKGRRILIAWMNGWETKIPTQKYNWAGAMTLPRVLTFLPDGKLSTRPVPELQELRKEHSKFKSILVTPTSTNVLNGIKGDCLELEAVFQLDSCSATEFGIKLRCSSNCSEETLVIYDIESKILSVDRNKSGVGDKGISECKLELANGENLKLQIYLDRSSLEVFGNDGRVAITNRIYPNKNSLGIDLFAKNGFVNLISFDVWKLENIW